MNRKLLSNKLGPFIAFRFPAHFMCVQEIQFIIILTYTHTSAIIYIARERWRDERIKEEREIGKEAHQNTTLLYIYTCRERKYG